MPQSNIEVTASETVAENYWPYSERNGMDAESDVELLLSEPQFHLMQAERSRVTAFAQGLFDGDIPGVERCASSRNLEGIYQASVLDSQQKFYLGYLRTEKGSEQAKEFGLATDAPDEVLVAQLNDLDMMRNFEPKKRKLLAANSTKWFKKELSSALEGDPENDKDWHDLPSTVVHYEPQKLIDKLYDIQAYRTFLRNVRRVLPAETNEHVSIANSTLLDVYASRVNSMMADLYPHAVTLAEQIDRMPDNEQRHRLETSLSAAVPIINAARNDEMFAVRLDRIRNGVALENGSFTPFSKDLLALAEQKPTQNTPPAHITPEIIAEMDKTNWQAEDMKVFVEDVLGQWDMLSEYQNTWEEVGEREGYSPDKKWQVVITPQVKSFSVDGRKRIVKVPDVFDRSLTQVAPAGALMVTGHELAHVLQSEFDDALAKQLPLAAVRGRRSNTLREGGGIYEEQRMQGMLGRDRAINFHYLRAAQVKESGGTMLEVARAFYNSKIAGKQLNDKELAKARGAAAGNILRFYRRGSYDTQALDYSEQALLIGAMNAMPAEQQARMVIAGGSFNLHDAAVLHSVDMFAIPEGRMHDPATTVIRTYLERYRHKKPSEVAKS